MFSALSRARNPRVESANNLLGALAKDDIFAGRTRLEFLDPGFGGLQVSNDFNPFEIHDVYLLQNVEGRFHCVTCCNKAGKLTRARFATLSESSKSSTRSFVFQPSENPRTAIQYPALQVSRLA